MGKKRDDGSSGATMMSDEELTRISKQHASSGAIHVAGGLQSFSPAIDPDLQIAEQYMSLGKALKLKGDYKSAIQEMSKALEIRRKAVGKEHPDTASTYYQLGICHTQAKDYPQALTELKRALTLGRLCWGRTHEDTGEFIRGLSISLGIRWCLRFLHLRFSDSYFSFLTRMYLLPTRNCVECYGRLRPWTPGIEKSVGYLPNHSGKRTRGYRSDFPSHG